MRELFKKLTLIGSNGGFTRVVICHRSKQGTCPRCKRILRLER